MRVIIVVDKSKMSSWMAVGFCDSINATMLGPSLARFCCLAAVMALSAMEGVSLPEVALWGAKLTCSAGVDGLVAALTLLVLVLFGAGLMVAVGVVFMLGYHCGVGRVDVHTKKATVVSLPAMGKSLMM